MHPSIETERREHDDFDLVKDETVVVVTVVVVVKAAVVDVVAVEGVVVAVATAIVFSSFDNDATF